MSGNGNWCVKVYLYDFNADNLVNDLCLVVRRWSWIWIVSKRWLWTWQCRSAKVRKYKNNGHTYIHTDRQTSLLNCRQKDRQCPLWSEPLLFMVGRNATCCRHYNRRIAGVSIAGSVVCMRSPGNIPLLPSVHPTLTSLPDMENIMTCTYPWYTHTYKHTHIHTHTDTHTHIHTQTHTHTLKQTITQKERMQTPSPYYPHFYNVTLSVTYSFKDSSIMRTCNLLECKCTS